MGIPWCFRWQRIFLYCRRPRFDPWVRKIPLRRDWQPPPVFLPRKFHGLRSLVGYSPWDCKESDMTEQPALSLILCLPVIFILSIPVSYIYDIGKMVSNSWGYKRNLARASIFTWISTFSLGEVHPGILKNTHYFIVFIYTKMQHYFIALFSHSFSCLLSSWNLYWD